MSYNDLEREFERLRSILYGHESDIEELTKESKRQTELLEEMNRRDQRKEWEKIGEELQKAYQQAFNEWRGNYNTDTVYRAEYDFVLIRVRLSRLSIDMNYWYNVAESRGVKPWNLVKIQEDMLYLQQKEFEAADVLMDKRRIYTGVAQERDWYWFEWTGSQTKGREIRKRWNDWKQYYPKDSNYRAMFDKIYSYSRIEDLKEDKEPAYVEAREYLIIKESEAQEFLNGKRNSYSGIFQERLNWASIRVPAFFVALDRIEKGDVPKGLHKPSSTKEAIKALFGIKSEKKVRPLEIKKQEEMSPIQKWDNWKQNYERDPHYRAMFDEIIANSRISYLEYYLKSPEKDGYFRQYPEDKTRNSKLREYWIKKSGEAQEFLNGKRSVYEGVFQEHPGMLCIESVDFLPSLNELEKRKI